MLIKQKNLSLPRNLALLVFELLIVLKKGKSDIPSLFPGHEIIPPVSDKANLLTENFAKNSNLDDSSMILTLPF